MKPPFPALALAVVSSLCLLRAGEMPDPSWRSLDSQTLRGKFFPVPETAAAIAKILGPPDDFSRPSEEFSFYSRISRYEILTYRIEGNRVLKCLVFGPAEEKDAPRFRVFSLWLEKSGDKPERLWVIRPSENFRFPPLDLEGKKYRDDYKGDIPDIPAGRDVSSR